MAETATTAASSVGEPVLVRTKMRPPPVREGFIARQRLQDLLEAGTRTRVSLVDAPAGSGKTALLASWCRAAQDTRPVAWVSLDDGENDPLRFWTYVAEALNQVQPGLGKALRDLGAPETEQVLTEVVLPRLLNDLDTLDADLVLVLDDLHAVRNEVCHRTLAFFIDRMPAHVHLVLATRVDPPLPLARLRARGDLCEIRSTDLVFTEREAAALLNGSIGLDLTEDQVRRLWRLAEGWPAGLYLAGLSLRSGADADRLIATFQAGHRHVFDYLGSEVLGQLSGPVQDFLTRTSVARRLCAPLCDAIRGSTDSEGYLQQLQLNNLFLVPLDGRGRWYRYHHLFATLLRLELKARDPELVVECHRRAMDWYISEGEVEEALYHAVAAGDHERAGTLIAENWLAYQRSGQSVTVGRWLAMLPQTAIRDNPRLAVVAAWIDGKLGASREAVERWLAVAEAGRPDEPVPSGAFTVPFGIAAVRAMNCYDDVRGSVLAALAALGTAGSSREWWSVAAAALGRTLYLAGDGESARAVLETLARDLPSVEAQPFVTVNVLALLSLLDDEAQELARADVRSRAALEAAQAQRVRYDPMSGVAHIARARALLRSGGLDEAESLLVEGERVLRPPSFALQRAEALLDLALVRHARGEQESARTSLTDARDLVGSFRDPGILRDRLRATARLVFESSEPRVPDWTALTPSETRVLRLLDTSLSQGEIARELYVSVNTVRSHIRAVYRKLGVSSRHEAVTVSRGEGAGEHGAHTEHGANTPHDERFGRFPHGRSS